MLWTMFVKNTALETMSIGDGQLRSLKTWKSTHVITRTNNFFLKLCNFFVHPDGQNVETLFIPHGFTWPTTSALKLRIQVPPDDQDEETTTAAATEVAATAVSATAVASTKAVTTTVALPSRYPPHMQHMPRNERRRLKLPFDQECGHCGFVWVKGSVSISQCETYRSMCKLKNRPCKQRAIEVVGSSTC